MLEVLYNDGFNDLSFVHIVDKESLAVIDSNFQVYSTICYNPFEPSNEDLLDMWKKATREYYSSSIRGDAILREWRRKQRSQSDNNFKKWLKRSKNNEEQTARSL